MSFVLAGCTFLVALFVAAVRADGLLPVSLVTFFPTWAKAFLENDFALFAGLLLALLVNASLADQLKKARKLEAMNAETIEALEDEIREKALEARKFQQAVENSSEASAIVLPDLRYVYVNPAWQRITGYSRAEALGKTTALLQSSRMKPSVIDGVLRTGPREGNSRSDQCVLKRKNGEEYYAEEAMYPILDLGKLIFYVLTHRDITARVRSDHAKSEFISLASHQLRTPMTAVRLTLSAFLRGQLGTISAQAEEAASRAMEYLINMAETVRTMLSISRLEEGSLKPAETPIVLATLLASIREDFEPEIKRKKQRCGIECPADLICVTDQALVREVIENLWSNALKYTAENGSILLRASREGKNLRLDVEDSGYGIPTYQQEKTFTKFFRADNVMKMKTEGTGLGLYLAHAITRLLGGSLAFTSVENAGSTFTIFLPLLPPHA